MENQGPIAVFDRDWKPAVWGNVLVLFVVFTIVAVLVRGSVASSLGTGEIGSVLIVSLGLTLLAAIVTIWRHTRNGPVTFYRDRVVVDEAPLRYEDIAVAIHEDADTASDAVGSFGTGRFALFAPGDTVMRFDYVENPGEVRRVLADNIAAPADQLDEESATETHEHGQRYITDRGQFWDYWRGDRQLPDTAVIHGGRLETVLDVDAYNLELLDRVDMTGRKNLGDITQDELTQSEVPSGGQ